jgi:hypothetical protein
MILPCAFWSTPSHFRIHFRDICKSEFLIFLSQRYGEDAVLDMLPLCIKDKTATWYTGLTTEMTGLMFNNLNEWKAQFSRRLDTIQSVRACHQG